MKVYFSAGDPSGDQHCAPIVAALKQRFPEVVCRGLGGPSMVEAGFDGLFPFERFNRMGYVDVLKELPFLLKSKSAFIEKLREEKPDLLVCVDYSGFNRPVMKAAHALGIPVFWYIAPMIWVWKKKKHGLFLGKYASHIGTILPFEKEHWLPFTEKVSYVGNPLLEDLPEPPVRKALSDKNPGVLALLPGSRRSEIATMLPQMLSLAERIHAKYPQMALILSQAPMLPEELFENIPEYVKVQKGDFEELLHKADLAVVTSGTATLHAALAHLPHAIIYKTSFLNYLIIRLFVRNLKWIGLPNIIADKMIVPEFVQHYDAEDIVNYVETTIENPAIYLSQVEGLKGIHEKFGDASPSKEVVKIMCDMLGETYEA